MSDRPFHPAPLCAPYLELVDQAGVVVVALGGRFPSEIVAAVGDIAFVERELDLGEGPCWDAVQRLAPVRIASTAQIQHRWTVLAASKPALRPTAVTALPLTFAGLTVGAVEIATAENSLLPSADLAAAQTLTASTALQVMGLLLHDSVLEASANPYSRRVVHQATGMVLSAFRVSPAEALVILRAHAFAVGSPVSDVAEEIVNRRSTFLTSSATEEQSW